MKFEKGHEKKGGRKAGTPNKATADIKAMIVTFVSENFEAIAADIQDLEPKDRVNAFLKFLEYTVAKQRETKFDVSGMTDEQLDEVLKRFAERLPDSEDEE